MTARSHPTGHVLLGTITFLVLATLLWLAAFSAISSNLRTAKLFLLRQDREHGAERAVAWGLALLETGIPPQDPYSCRATVDDNRTYVITFDMSPSLEEFTLSVRPATVADAELPYAPDEF